MSSCALFFNHFHSSHLLQFHMAVQVFKSVSILILVQSDQYLSNNRQDGVRERPLHSKSIPFPYKSEFTDNARSDLYKAKRPVSSYIVRPGRYVVIVNEEGYPTIIRQTPTKKYQKLKKLHEMVVYDSLILHCFLILHI